MEHSQCWGSQHWQLSNIRFLTRMNIISHSIAVVRINARSQVTVCHSSLTRLRLIRLDKGFFPFTNHNPHYPMPKLITISSYARAKQLIKLTTSDTEWYFVGALSSLELEGSSTRSSHSTSVTSRSWSAELKSLSTSLGGEISVFLHIITEVLLDNLVSQLVYLHIFMIL